MAAVTVGLLVLLALLSWAEASGSAFQRVDAAVLNWVLAHRAGWVTPTARAVTDSGASALLFPLVGLAGLAVRRHTGRWAPGAAAVVVVVVGVMSRLGLSRLVRDPRPPRGDWLVSVSGFSFPSGHAATSTLVAGALAWLLACAVQARGARTILMLMCAIWAVLVSLSRVYLGVHWISDIIGSWLLAGAWLTALCATRWHVLLPRPPHGSAPRGKRTSTHALRPRP
ncbi:MAG: phosphatase PAP2 family protein [Frankiaceae bacterium]